MSNDTVTLLEALREQLGVKSVKDGCSPQGQCGCCTVLIDGSARVACVTPVRRVAGRSVVTVDGLDPSVIDPLVEAFSLHGASQCGFCTPGILCRLASLGQGSSPEQVETAMLAHLCRCTGWRSIVAAATDSLAAAPGPPAAAARRADRDNADRRAAIEGGTLQRTGSDVVMGRAGFADDTSPADCLVAVPVAHGGTASPGAAVAAGIEWSVAETLVEARGRSGKVQGRRSGQDLTYPVAVPPGDWDVTLQTTWIEPAYLEPDSSWCAPGGQPASPVANGGAFGAKASSLAPTAAQELARALGRPVRVLLSREDVVRLGPKRPPVGAGIRLDGTGTLRVADPGNAGDREVMTQRVTAAAGGLTVEFVPVEGPPLSSEIRAAGWAEAAILAAAVRGLAGGSTGGAVPALRMAEATVEALSGSRARASVEIDETGWPKEVTVEIECGRVLDEVVLRSYVVGAAHMALGWVCSEAIAIGVDGVPEDLTIRSFGILRAKDTPPVTVLAQPSESEPVNGSDAAFAAVAAATWLAQGLPSRWPTRRGGMK